MNKEYTVDMSKDGLEWEEYRVGGDLEALVAISKSFYELGWFVSIYDENEVLVWRDDRYANIFYQLSPFEQEWMAIFGTPSPRYQSVLMEVEDGN